MYLKSLGNKLFFERSSTMRKYLLCLLGVGLAVAACGPNWITHELLPCGCPTGGETPGTPDEGVPPAVTPPEEVVDSGSPEITEDAGTPEEPVVDAGTPETDAGTPECRPGYGYGDDNHCHSGPPGLDAGTTETPDAGGEHPTCKNGYGWGDDNHCHLKSCGLNHENHGKGKK
jgi:hypothetical protein